MTEPLFTFRNVRFGYERARQVLDALDLEITEGDFLGIIGPNGAGKSTLLAMMSGWLRPSAGTVTFRGKSIAEWPRRQFAREVAIVPQSEEGVFPYTVEEVVLMGRFAHQSPIVGFDDEEDHAIARGVLELVGLGGFAHRTLDRLSGGERQRVLLARALAQCPSVLLLDEPTASLDLSFQRDVFRLLESLNREHGVTVVAVTHDINLASLYSRRLAVLFEGGIKAEGAPEAVCQPGLLGSIYRVPIETLASQEGHSYVTFRK